MRLLSLSKTITQNKLKTLAFIHHEDTRVSVGSFSPVLSVFFLYELGNTISLFLLLDHVGTGNLKISHLQNGISTHPPRGSETVILMFADEVEHRDLSGGGGIISAGDVQWMTAASGIRHKGVFSKDRSDCGGRVDMLPLWINLPAKDKMNPPHY